MASYASATDLVNHYDANVVADLASDSEVPESNLAGSAKVAAALNYAGGRVESALTVANQYAPADLAALTDTSQELLRWLVCSLAMGRLLGRRPGSRHEETYKAAVEDAEEFLDRLRKGERVFGGAAKNRDAGLPAIDGPTLAVYERLNLLPDRTQHYYPSRGRSLPIGRGSGGP